MAEKRDYYEVLGVDRDADQRAIKRAFLKKARECILMFQMTLMPRSFLKR